MISLVLRDFLQESPRDLRVLRGKWFKKSEEQKAKSETMSEPQHNLTVDHLEVVDGRDRQQIEGWIPELASEADLREALEQAFDYRGDVTITRKDGSRVEGYIFDRRNGATLALCCAAHSQGFAAENFHSLFRHRRPGLQRTRHRRRQKLGSLGPQVLGEESRRREEHRAGAGKPGLENSGPVAFAPSVFTPRHVWLQGLKPEFLKALSWHG